MAPELDLLLRAASDPVDVGAPEVLGLQIRGGWAPFVGTVSSPGGTILPFQGSSTNLTFVLTPSAVGPLPLAAQATDALGASATASLDLAVDPAPTADLVLGAGRKYVAVPHPFKLQPRGATGTYPTV